MNVTPFIQQLADRRTQEQKPKQGVGGGGGRGPQIIVNPARSTLQNDSRGGSAGRGSPAENPARTTIQTQNEDQLQLERKKHQEMVEQASRAQRDQQGDGSSSQKLTNESSVEKQEKVQQKKIETRQVDDASQSQQNQTTQELRRTAAEASTKRTKKAQDASVSFAQPSHGLMISLFRVNDLNLIYFYITQIELKRQNQMKAEAIRREQSERRAREEAIRKRQEDEQRRKANEEKAQAAKINAEKEGAEQQVSCLSCFMLSKLVVRMRSIQECFSFDTLAFITRPSEATGRAEK